MLQTLGSDATSSGSFLGPPALTRVGQVLSLTVRVMLTQGHLSAGVLPHTPSPSPQLQKAA